MPTLAIFWTNEEKWGENNFKGEILIKAKGNICQLTITKLLAKGKRKIINKNKVSIFPIS